MNNWISEHVSTVKKRFDVGYWGSEESAEVLDSCKSYLYSYEDCMKKMDSENICEPFSFGFVWCLYKQVLTTSQFNTIKNCFENEDESEQCRDIIETSQNLTEKKLKFAKPDPLSFDDWESISNCIKDNSDFATTLRCYSTICKNEFQAAERCISNNKGNPASCSKEILKFVEASGRVHLRAGLKPPEQT